MTDEVVVLPAIWTPAFCRGIQRAMDDGDADAAEIVQSGFSVDTQARHAFDVTIDPDWQARVDQALRTAWPQLLEHFGLTAVESLGSGCLRYPPGGRYGRHRDRDAGFGSLIEDRRVSLIVWLNAAGTTTDRGDFEGGMLRLYPAGRPPIEITPTTGALVAFPSDWLHEVLPVTRGTRDVVIDWLCVPAST